MDWSEVAASPYSFRDAAVIGEVIDDIVATATTTREAAGHALAAVVKALEDEPVPGWQAWIARRLPELVFALAQPESSLAGSILSVMRRVRPRSETIERLLEQIAVTPIPGRRLLLEALGLCTEWDPRIETVLALELDGANAAVAAEVLYGLSWWPDRISRESTLDELARVARSADASARPHAIAALCMLVDSVRLDRAPAIIHELASTSSPDIRPTIAKCLRYRDSPRRRALLERIGGSEG